MIRLIKKTDQNFDLKDKVKSLRTRANDKKAKNAQNMRMGPAFYVWLLIQNSSFFVN